MNKHIKAHIFSIAACLMINACLFAGGPPYTRDEVIKILEYNHANPNQEKRFLEMMDEYLLKNEGKITQIDLVRMFKLVGIVGKLKIDNSHCTYHKYELTIEQQFFLHRLLDMERDSPEMSLQYIASLYLKMKLDTNLEKLKEILCSFLSIDQTYLKKRFTLEYGTRQLSVEDRSKLPKSMYLLITLLNANEERNARQSLFIDLLNRMKNKDFPTDLALIADYYTEKGCYITLEKLEEIFYSFGETEQIYLEKLFDMIDQEEYRKLKELDPHFTKEKIRFIQLLRKCRASRKLLKISLHHGDLISYYLKKQNDKQNLDLLAIFKSFSPKAQNFLEDNYKVNENKFAKAKICTMELRPDLIFNIGILNSASIVPISTPFTTNTKTCIMKFSPDSNTIVYQCTHNTYEIWTKKDEQFKFSQSLTLNTPNVLIKIIHFSTDNNIIVFELIDSTYRIWTKQQDGKYTLNTQILQIYSHDNTIALQFIGGTWKFLKSSGKNQTIAQSIFTKLLHEIQQKIQQTSLAYVAHYCQKQGLNITLKELEDIFYSFEIEERCYLEKLFNIIEPKIYRKLKKLNNDNSLTEDQIRFIQLLQKYKISFASSTSQKISFSDLTNYCLKTQNGKHNLDLSAIFKSFSEEAQKFLKDNYKLELSDSINCSIQ